MDEFRTTSFIFYVFIMTSCCGLFLKEIYTNLKTMCDSQRDTELTLSSEDDLSEHII